MKRVFIHLRASKPSILFMQPVDPLLPNFIVNGAIIAFFFLSFFLFNESIPLYLLNMTDFHNTRITYIHSAQINVRKVPITEPTLLGGDKDDF